MFSVSFCEQTRVDNTWICLREDEIMENLNTSQNEVDVQIIQRVCLDGANIGRAVRVHESETAADKVLRPVPREKNNVKMLKK